ncbi:hypothetical protein [Chitinophaga rhizophila]|uniref:Uncharacterized protein n=1 Tax=Chitinophaga rhizophila TaxID=2866212 RepID=A0ABS7G769_9BACT|nr:hypothetical protein [Chitinophaga rhizophila]MBW8683508.1 hypothetical protein [Chitinophaga rhizophila]
MNAFQHDLQKLQFKINSFSFEDQDSLSFRIFLIEILSKLAAASTLSISRDSRRVIREVYYVLYDFYKSLAGIIHEDTFDRMKTEAKNSVTLLSEGLSPESRESLNKYWR